MKNKIEQYRKPTINMIRVHFLPKMAWGDVELFATWFDNIYRKDLVELMKELGSFSEEEFQLLDTLDELVKEKYKEWKSTNKFTDEMWVEINKKRQEFLDQVE